MHNGKAYWTLCPWHTLSNIFGTAWLRCYGENFTKTFKTNRLRILEQPTSSYFACPRSGPTALRITFRTSPAPALPHSFSDGPTLQRVVSAKRVIGKLKQRWSRDWRQFERNNSYERISRFWLAENECILM